jgi:hypothetical protein
MIMGMTTWRKALANIFQSILGEFIAMCSKMVVQWAAAQLAKTALAKSGSLMRLGLEKLGIIEATTAETAAATTQAGIQKALGVSGVLSNAALAATAAMASVAAIPVYGWAMAPEVGAATFAGAMSYLPAAAKGYDIPAGINPLTQLHQKEMVLPAEHADVIRGLAGGRGGSGDHFHVHAVDTAGMERLLRDNGHILAKELRRQSRNFSPKNT